MSVDPKDIRRRFEALQAERRGWEGHWQEIAERVLPRQADFLGQRQPGAKRAEKIFDSTAPLALERFAAAMESMLTPRGQRWHHLRIADEDVNGRHEVREWLDAVERALFSARYLPRANYASQQHEVYMALGAFGTGALLSARMSRAGSGTGRSTSASSMWRRTRSGESTRCSGSSG